LDTRDIFIGVNAVDFSGYPDCRPAFIRAFAEAADWAPGRESREAVRYPYPAAMAMSKAEIIRTGLSLGIDYSLTHSCYDPVDGLACGHWTLACCGPADLPWPA